jgi:hypothetical protein
VEGRKPGGLECYNDVCLQGTIPDSDMVGIACAPNRVVNFSDVQAVLDAFHSYPFTQSPGCAEVCTGAALPSAPANPYYFTGRRLDVAGGPLDGTGDEGLVSAVGLPEVHANRSVSYSNFRKLPFGVEPYKPWCHRLKGKLSEPCKSNGHPG